jgi:hypothetical protein
MTVRAPRSVDGRDIYRGRRPISTESHLSIKKQALKEPAFWHTSMAVVSSNHTLRHNMQFELGMSKAANLAAFFQVVVCLKGEILSPFCTPLVVTPI